jgi:hypothetical protein
MNYNVDSLIESRMRLAELRNSLRIFKSNLESSRFKIEKSAIDTTGGNYGKNAEERERFLKTALFESDSYLDLENRVISIQNEIELEEAKIECLRDLRKELDYQQKERMIDSDVSV